MDHPRLVQDRQSEPGDLTLLPAKPYEAPAVIYEAILEVRAGTPLPNMPDGLNLTGE